LAHEPASSLYIKKFCWFRNTHIVIDELGEVSATYKKCHLFDVDIPEKGVR
jgi:predicted amidohydrolase